MAWNNNVANLVANAQQNRESLRAKRDIAQMRYGNNTLSGGGSDGSLSVKDAIGLAIKYNEAKDLARDNATKWKHDQLQRLKEGVARIKAAKKAGMSAEAEQLEMRMLCDLYIDTDTTLGQVMSNVSGGIVDAKGNGVRWTPGNKEHIPIIANMAYATAQQQGVIQRLEQAQAQEQQAQAQAQEQQAQEPNSNIPYYKVPRSQIAKNLASFKWKNIKKLNARQQELIDTLSGDGYNEVVEALKKQGLNDGQIKQKIDDMLQDVGLIPDSNIHYKVPKSQIAKNLVSFKWKNIKKLNARQQELIDTLSGDGYNEVVEALKKQGLNDEQIKQKIDDMLQDVGLIPEQQAQEPKKNYSIAQNLESNVDPDASVARSNQRVGLNKGTRIATGTDFPSKDNPTNAKVDYYNMIQDCLEKNDCSALPPELQEVVFNTARNSYIGQKDGKPAVFNPNMILPYMSDGRAEQISSFTEHNNALASMFPAMKEQIDAGIQQEQARRNEHTKLMDEINTNTPEYFRAVALRQGQLNTIDALGKQNIFINNAPNSTQLQNAVAAAPTMQSDPSRLDKTNNIQPKVIKGGSGSNKLRDTWNLHAAISGSDTMGSTLPDIDNKYKNNPEWPNVQKNNISQVVKFLKKNKDTSSLNKILYAIENAQTTFGGLQHNASKSPYNTPLTDKEFSRMILAHALNMTDEQLQGPDSENNILQAAIRKFKDLAPSGFSSEVESKLSAALKGKDPLLAAAIKNMYSTAYVSAKDLAALRAAGLNESVLREVLSNFRTQMDKVIEYSIDNKPNSVIPLKRLVENAQYDIKMEAMLDAYKELDSNKISTGDTKVNKKELVAETYENGDEGLVVRFRDKRGGFYTINRVTNTLVSYRGQ